MKIKLRLLEVFVSVVENQSLQKSSQNLNRTVSSISMALKQLEDYLQYPLFKGDRKSQLTPLGDFVYQRAKLALKERDQLFEDIETFTKGTTDTIRIAAVPSMAQTLLPNIIANEINSHIKFKIWDMDSASVTNSVFNGKVQLGIASMVKARNNLRYEPLLEENLCILCHHSNPLAKQTHPIQWEDLKQQEFIMSNLSHNIQSPPMKKIAQKARIHVFNMISLYEFIKQDLGIAFVPKSSKNYAPECVMLNCDFLNVTRELYLIYRKDSYLSPAYQKTIESLKTYTQNNLKKLR